MALAARLGLPRDAMYTSYRLIARRWVAFARDARGCAGDCTSALALSTPCAREANSNVMGVQISAASPQPRPFAVQPSPQNAALLSSSLRTYIHIPVRPCRRAPPSRCIDFHETPSIFARIFISACGSICAVRAQGVLPQPHAGARDLRACTAEYSVSLSRCCCCGTSRPPRLRHSLSDVENYLPDAALGFTQRPLALGDALRRARVMRGHSCDRVRMIVGPPCRDEMRGGSSAIDRAHERWWRSS
jgi:hypothetical protein